MNGVDDFELGDFFSLPAVDAEPPGEVQTPPALQQGFA